MKNKRNYLNRYNRARRVMKRERARGNKLINSVGPADILIAQLFNEWNASDFVFIKPPWCSTAAKRRKFRRERAVARIAASK